MLPEEFLDSPIILDVGMGGDIEETSFGGRANTSPILAFKEPGYEGEIDYRIRQLSYSSILKLHNCPRKYQLYKLRTTEKLDEAPSSTITFAYGHCVGLGIQLVLEGKGLDSVVWEMFLLWHAPDLFSSEEKTNKSFFECVLAIQKFISMREQGLLKEYELVIYKGNPAVELSFCINFPDGFRYRGFVDAVLQSKETGKVLVLECKTTGSKVVNPATFKNSAQAIGYSIVLDSIFPELSSYDVLYFVYQSTTREFTQLPFHKTYLQRALWIRELLLDIETIKMYEAAEVYPMHGESCFSFFRECEYINTCTLSTAYLTRPATEKDLDKIEYQINVSLLDVLEAQLEKS